MSEFRRERHRFVQRFLSILNAELLGAAHCFFGGGTRIVLELNEYRESLDLDFLCADQSGYRLLRSNVTNASLGSIDNGALTLAREVRADMYGIRTFVELDGVVLKFEIIREARIPLAGSAPGLFPVPTLGHADCVAEKLLANADRGLDVSTRSRDLVDLAFMAASWPSSELDAGLAVAEDAYGNAVLRGLTVALERFSDRGYRSTCLRELAVDGIPTLNRGLRALRRLAKGGN